MLAVQPIVELAKRFSRQRIDPLIEESGAVLREKVSRALARRWCTTTWKTDPPCCLTLGCYRAQRGEGACLVVHRRDPCAGARPPRVWRGGAREVPVGYKAGGSGKLAVGATSAAVPQRITRFACSVRHALTIF